MPTTNSGKAVSSRNATTHGVFARDIVLPTLGEDPEGYAQLQAEWTGQLVPRNLLEQHYVEKIAAASWRLRRLHRWQAQLFEDDTLSEDERLDKLDKVLRHETALHRQIDTAVKLLAKDVPQLYARRLRDQVLEDMHISERECRDEPETDLMVSLETGNRLYQLRKATTQAANELSEAPLDTVHAENCQNEPVAVPKRPYRLRPCSSAHRAVGVLAARPALQGGGMMSPHSEICQNEPAAVPIPCPRRRSLGASPPQRRTLVPRLGLPSPIPMGGGAGGEGLISRRKSTPASRTKAHGEHRSSEYG